jgi:hypothetical protein
MNKDLRQTRAANFCAAVQSGDEDSWQVSFFKKSIQSCRDAPAGTFAASNATREGRDQNRSVLIRVVPPVEKKSKSQFPYDETHGPSAENCSVYPALRDILGPIYTHNAFCACTHTPDEPHNNCVRSCLQDKILPFAFRNQQEIRDGTLLWCPSIWQQHRECYEECGCDNRFVSLELFLPLCSEKFSCQTTGLSIALINSCMDKKSK